MVKASKRSYATALEQLHAEKIHDLLPADWAGVAPVLLIEKVCTGCGVSKVLGMFHQEQKGIYGRKASCKACIKQAARTCAQCNTRASFGLAGEGNTHCGQHKTEDMKSKHNMCTGCRSKQASYNIIGLPARYCRSCKLADMIDVRSKQCEQQGCRIRASYGYDKMTHCVAHKDIDMMYIKKTGCNQCNKMANYALPGQKASVCGDHATAGMIDVVNKRCDDLDCDIQAHFGIPGVSRSTCYEHKTAGMILIKHLRCKAGGCSNAATHGIRFADRCEACAPEDYINLVLQNCSSCGLEDVLNGDNLCSTCVPGAGKTCLVKQTTYVAILKHQHKIEPHFVDTFFKLDTEVKCFRQYRPDLTFDFNKHVLIVEIDEFAHKGYNIQCEINRMINIADYLQRPTVYIRINPDNYKLNGINQKASENDRVAELARYIAHYSEFKNVPEGVSVAHLFFDEFDKGDKGLNIKQVRYDEEM